MQHIVPYTPQQNGVDKRKNHTLNKMENCMIQSKGLIALFGRKPLFYQLHS